jgi:hypothetical protein
MRLDGSCQCGKVRFRVDSATPYPYMYCYCSICRKTAGGPFGCNIMGRRETLVIRGAKHLRCYHAVIRRRGRRPVRSEGERWFCADCGSHLYVLDGRWPEGVWPNAAAIDTSLPVPPEHVHLMLRYKPKWVVVAGRGPRYAEYPPLSIAEWHERHGLKVKSKVAKRGAHAGAARRRRRNTARPGTRGKKTARRSARRTNTARRRGTRR